MQGETFLVPEIEKLYCTSTILHSLFHLVRHLSFTAINIRSYVTITQVVGSACIYVHANACVCVCVSVFNGCAGKHGFHL